MAEDDFLERGFRLTEEGTPRHSDLARGSGSLTGYSPPASPRAAADVALDMAGAASEASDLTTPLISGNQPAATFSSRGGNRRSGRRRASGESGAGAHDSDGGSPAPRHSHVESPLAAADHRGNHRRAPRAPRGPPRRGHQHEGAPGLPLRRLARGAPARVLVHQRSHRQLVQTRHHAGGCARVADAHPAEGPHLQGRRRAQDVGGDPGGFARGRRRPQRTRAHVRAPLRHRQAHVRAREPGHHAAGDARGAPRHRGGGLGVPGG